MARNFRLGFFAPRAPPKGPDMGLSSLARKTAVVAAAGAALALATAGTSDAATGSATATRPGATSAGSPSAGAATVTFTAKRRPGQVGPLAVYGCTIAPPQAIVNQFHQTTWSAGTQCNISLRQQGTTALYVWGNGNAYAFGTAYDNVASAEMSTGGPISTNGGQWGLNNNVLLFSPPGYTTTPGGGCYWYDAGQTQIKCTATTGPFTG
jgi:hypothetical protein